MLKEVQIVFTSQKVLTLQPQASILLQFYVIDQQKVEKKLCTIRKKLYIFLQTKI